MTSTQIVSWDSRLESDQPLYNCFRCGNVAAILELDEDLDKDFTIFEAAPQVIVF